MNWSQFIPGLIVGLLSVIFHTYGKKVKYPEELEFDGQPISFKGDYFAGFISLVFSTGFCLGFFLFPIYDIEFWVYLIMVILLIAGFFHFAYYGFFCRVIIWPDNTVEYRTLHQKANFQLSEVKAVRAWKTGLIVQLSNGQKILFSTTLDHHENLFGYLYDQAGDKFSKRARKMLESGRAFLKVI